MILRVETFVMRLMRSGVIDQVSLIYSALLI